MSTMPGTNPSGGGDARRKRAASVTLRQGEGQRVQSVGDLMDPANKSLADALRIAYRLLQASIVVMLVLFALSGIQQVGASEVGMRVTLGKIVGRNLPQGLAFSWPQPFGDVLKVKRTDELVEVKKAFFPGLSKTEEDTLNDPAKRQQGLADGGRDFLDPDSDGALLTADGFMVHTRWQVTYRRKDGTDGPTTLERIASDAQEEKDRESTERQIVTAAIRRGVVLAASSMTVDEVLYDQSENKAFRRVDVVAKEEAQKLLNQMNIGIELQQFKKVDQIPPRFVIKSFNDVQSAQARAGAERTDAQAAAQQKLAQAAGEGAPVILSQIDMYESQLAAGKTAEADATLARIHALMQRQTVTIDGKEVHATVSGDVSRRLSDATQYRTSVVSRARSDASAYTAKLAAFRANPQVFLSGEWTDAYTTFSRTETLQTMLLPPGLERLVLRINKDPEVDKDVKMKLAAKEAEDAALKRKKDREDEIHRRKLEGNSLEGS